MQTRLSEQVDIHSILLVPMKRFLSYSDILGTIQKAAKKAQLDTPKLRKARSLMVGISKRVNNIYILNVICGYDGNIHSNGELIEYVSIYTGHPMLLYIDGLIYMFVYSNVVHTLPMIPMHTHTQDLFNVKQHSLTTKQYYVFLQQEQIIFTEPPNADGECEFKFALEVSSYIQ